MKISFKIKLYLTFLFYGFSLVFFTQFIVYKLDEINIKKVSIEKAALTFTERDKLFHSYIKDTKLKILAIKNSNTFKNYLSNSENDSLVKSLFFDIASTSDNIMQLRYINAKGMEVIRIDRDSYASSAIAIQDIDLQDKSNRYYFNDIINTEKDTFWYSKLDLNVERGEIEKPIKPVIRIGTPVYNNGENAGVLIINVFMKTFLKELTATPLFNVYLFDKDGNVIVDSIHDHCWSRYPEKKESIHTLFSKDSKEILSHNQYQTTDFYAKKIFLNNGEEMYMILEPKAAFIQHENSENVYQLALIMFGIILLSLPFAYFFSRIPVKLKEQVDKQKNEQDVLLSLFDLSDTVLFKWNNDERWSVNYVSKSVDKLLGYSQNDFQSNAISYSSCVHHDDLNQVMKEVTDAIENNVYFFEHKPYRIVNKDGDIKWILDSTVVVRNEKNEIINFLGYLNDITELKDNEIALQKLSRTDQLTKINNRMHLDDVLQHQYYRFYRDQEVTSIILIDIDYFKAVNDEYGHLVGDKVLIEFSNILQSGIRKGDILGRWGGEEFLIILPHTNLSQALILSEKLRQSIDKHTFETIGRKTASFGVSTFEKDMSVEQVIDSADISLYQAKELGRNRVLSIQNKR